jgi:hypothetical protein
MKVTYYINGEIRTASPLNDAEMKLFMGIVQRAGGYIVEATVIRGES